MRWFLALSGLILLFIGATTPDSHADEGEAAERAHARYRVAEQLIGEARALVGKTEREVQAAEARWRGAENALVRDPASPATKAELSAALVAVETAKAALVRAQAQIEVAESKRTKLFLTGDWSPSLLARSRQNQEDTEANRIQTQFLSVDRRQAAAKEQRDQALQKLKTAEQRLATAEAALEKDPNSVAKRSDVRAATAATIAAEAEYTVASKVYTRVDNEQFDLFFVGNMQLTLNWLSGRASDTVIAARQTTDRTVSKVYVATGEWLDAIHAFSGDALANLSDALSPEMDTDRTTDEVTKRGIAKNEETSAKAGAAR